MNVLVVCASGMSSSALVQKLRREVADRNITDIKIGSCANGELSLYAVQADVIVFAPQISFAADSFQNPYGAKVMVLEGIEYGRQDAKRILDRIIRLTSSAADSYPAKSAVNKEKVTYSGPFSALLGFILPVPVLGLICILMEMVLKKYGMTQIAEVFRLGSDMTIGCISLYLCAGITAVCAHSQREHSSSAVVSSIACFLILSCEFTEGYTPMTYFGWRGLFSAVLISLPAAILFLYIRNLIQPAEFSLLPEAIRESFMSLVPFLICLSLSAAAEIAIHAAGYTSLPQMIESIFSPII